MRMSVRPSLTSVAKGDVSTWWVDSSATVTPASPQDQMKSVKVTSPNSRSLASSKTSFFVSQR